MVHLKWSISKFLQVDIFLNSHSTRSSHLSHTWLVMWFTCWLKVFKYETKSPDDLAIHRNSADNPIQWLKTIYFLLLFIHRRDSWGLIDTLSIYCCWKRILDLSFQGRQSAFFKTWKCFIPRRDSESRTDGGPIVFTYRGYQAKSPPPLAFFLQKKGVGLSALRDRRPKKFSR